VRVAGFRGQRFRGSGVQGSEVEGFRGSEVEGFRGSGVAGYGFRVAGVALRVTVFKGLGAKYVL
jgi:hypothetical protein